MKRTSVPKKRELKVVALEDRKLMAVDFANGTLTVTGTPGNDSIAVAADNEFLSIFANTHPNPPTNTPISAIRNIEVSLGGGRDTFHLGGQNSHFWNLDSVRVNMGTGGSGGRDLAVIAAGSIGNLIVRSTSLSGTEVRL